MLKKPSFYKVSALSLGLLGMSAFTITTMNAQQLLNETFPYADGTALTATGNYTAFSGAGTLPITASGSTVTVTNLATGASGEDDRYTFTATPITTGILYYSALVKVNGTVTGANGDYFFAPYNTATTGGGYFGRIFVSATATGMAFGLSNAATVPTDGADIVANTYYKLVLRVDLGTKTSTLGVFDPSVVPTTDTQLNIAGAGVVSSVAGLDSFALRQGSATGSAFTTVFDGVQVGDTLADVASISPSLTTTSVPEPSTYAMISLGLLGLVGMQQVRRRTA